MLNIKLICRLNIVMSMVRPHSFVNIISLPKDIKVALSRILYLCKQQRTEFVNTKHFNGFE